jgi:hypothetical protein
MEHRMPPFPTKAALAVACLASLLGGCGKKSPPPDKVFESFYSSMVLYHQEQFPEFQEAAFDLLDSASRSRLEAEARALSAQLPGGVEIQPHALLVSFGPVHHARIRRTEVTPVTGSEDRVQVRAALHDDNVVEATLIREGDGWRVVL